MTPQHNAWTPAGHDLLPRAPIASAPLCLYLSGPMTGLPGNNYAAFNRAARVLRDMGYEVRNPAELVPPYMWAIRRGAAAVDWRDWMRVALALMMQCDEIVMLDCWEESKGACMERDIAERLGWVCPTLAQVLAGEIDGRGR